MSTNGRKTDLSPREGVDVAINWVMPAFHSSLAHNGHLVGNMGMLPLNTKYRGPAPQAAGSGPDVIDEALQYFKANVFFRTYEVKVGLFNVVRLKFARKLVTKNMKESKLN